MSMTPSMSGTATMSMASDTASPTSTAMVREAQWEKLLSRQVSLLPLICTTSGILKQVEFFDHRDNIPHAFNVLIPPFHAPAVSRDRKANLKMVGWDECGRHL
jgi:hypothetical protein